MYSQLINRATITYAALVMAAIAWTATGTVARSLQVRGNAGPPGNSDTTTPIDFPRQVPGEIIVRLAPGLSGATLADQLQQQGVAVELRRTLHFAPNTAVLHVSGVEGQGVDISYWIDQVRQQPGVLYAEANAYARPLALPSVTPNDQYYPQQWALRILNAQRAWGITVGERFRGRDAEPGDNQDDAPPIIARVGVIDSGFQLTHPDLADIVAHEDPDDPTSPSLAWDFIRDAVYDETLASTYSLLGRNHGTAVAGCIAAETNNIDGLASLPWEGVSLIPCHVSDFQIVNNNPVVTMQESAIVDAIYYCMLQQADVINMSWEVPYSVSSPTGLITQAIQDAFAQGIIMVAGSGNNRFFNFNSVTYPATLDEVIPVGAIGPQSELAWYSQGGTDMAERGFVAPGGNIATFGTIPSVGTALLLDGTDTLNSFQFLLPAPAGYQYDEGTSYAAGFVSGAIATLITQGALLDVDRANRVGTMRLILSRSARRPFSSANTDYGNGIIDLEAALRQITPVIDVLQPQPNEETPNFAEPVVVRISQPDGSLLEPGEYRVFRNGVDVTSRVSRVNPATGTIEYRPSVNDRLNVGLNSINVVAVNNDYPALSRSLEGTGFGNVPARSYRIRVKPRVEHPGRKLLSVPYQLQKGANSLEFLFGGNLVRLARYLPDENRYAVYDILGAPQDPDAALLTKDSGVPRPPIGTGFWARVTATTPVQLYGITFDGDSYPIPLKPGFNLIGDPYPFDVPFNACSIRFGREILSTTDAAARGLIRNVIWSLVDNRYQFEALPLGTLRAWQAHWVENISGTRLTLLVPRVVSGGSAVTAAAPAPSGWRAALRMASGGRTSGEVFLGVRPGAVSTRGGEDVPAPPAPVGTSVLRIAHHDWGRASGAYLQDLRSPSAGLQRWNLELETFRPGEAVKLTWNGLPRAAAATLQVEGEPGTHPLTRAGSLQFTPKKAGTHRLTLVALPAPGA